MTSTQNQTMIKQKAFLFWFIVLLAASLACSLVSGSSAMPRTSVATRRGAQNATATKTIHGTTNAKTEAGSTETGPQEALSESFPLPADTTIDPESVSENNPAYGSFKLRSTAALSALVDFYQTTLPTQGWTYRYTDANTIGGVTQFWKKDNLYLSMQFGYDNTGALVKINYQRVAADALDKLPKDFPIPDKAELTDASDASWHFYIDQDYAAVIAFYTKASAPWASCSGPGSQGSGDDGGGQTFPPGVHPMPSPTRDSRPLLSYCWVLPSQNQVKLTVWPHGDAVLLYVGVKDMNPSDAGLPADVPIYPGATIESVSEGMVTFQAGASLETVKNYYKEKLTAAGWALDGQPTESQGAIMMNWKKGDQKVMITITTSGADDCRVMIIYEKS
jgi:hypothetical protein